MDNNINDTLNGFIDPALGGASSDPSPAPTAPVDQSDEHDLSIVSADAGPSNVSGGKKKKRSVVPGSAADFKRREANRLAAERSRTRAAERSHALKDASYRVSTENQRLKAEIARLELAATAAAAAEGVVPPDSADLPTIDPGDHAVIDPTLDQDQQAQQESHSQAILNALIQGVNSTAGVDGGAEDHAIWGELFAEPPESKEEKDKEGRLGELAELAAGQKGKGPSKSATSHHEDTSISPELLFSHFSLTDIKYDAEQAVAVATSSLAVAINAEMEKLIRDNMALTKAAIMNLEKQIVLLQSSPLSTAPGIVTVDPSLLPDSALSTDVEAINTSTSAIRINLERLEASLPQSRTKLFKARDARLQAEKTFAAMFEEYAVTLDDKDTEEKDKAIELVRGVGGYMADLIDALAETAQRSKSGAFAAPLSSPAIARRRRGRPPKAFPAQSAGVAGAEASSSAGKGKSRLSQSVHAGDLAGPSGGDDTAQEEQDHAETQMIISHLAQAQAHAQAQSQARALGQGGSVDLGAGADEEAEGMPLPPGIDEAALANYFKEHPLGDALDPSLASLKLNLEGSGLLSRLRKGPPESCDICGRTETSVWRKLSLHGEDFRVCNACGLYHTKFGVIRPSVLWGDGKSLKKRRPGRRSSAGEDEDGEDGKKRRKMDDSDDVVDEVEEGRAAAGLGESEEEGQPNPAVALGTETLGGDQELFTID